MAGGEEPAGAAAMAAYHSGMAARSGRLGLQSASNSRDQRPASVKRRAQFSIPRSCFVPSPPRRPGRRNHFPSSAKSSGNEPVLGFPLDGEESYDRVHHGSRCVVQHQHLRGSCFRRVSDALMGIFMDRSNLPSADPSTVWLADLVEATEAVAASAEPCDPAIVEAFSHRLGVAHRCQTLVRTGRLGHGRIRTRRAFSNIVKLRHA
jgi:hypothetical protein